MTASPSLSRVAARNPPPPAMGDLLDRWDRCPTALPLDALVRGLQSLRLSRAGLGAFVAFGRDCYRRNRLHAAAAYEVLVLCWSPGQRSPIHDHRGSACGVRVIEGVATETQFALSPCGLIYPTRTDEWNAGSVIASFDADIHQMGNLQARCDLVTLHVYSPPLRRMNRYYLGDSILGERDEVLRARVAQRAARRRPPAVAAAVAHVRRRAATANSRLALHND